MLAALKNTWLFNLRGDLPAGLLVAQIAEASAFSISAGVDPKLGQDQSSATLVERFGVHDKAEAQTDVLQH